MSDEVKQKLFRLDQHVTTVGTSKETGTGLGLIICQEMVIKSGGQIWVESELGQGTTVCFTVQLDKSGIK
jgi:signal transduction histidine kinase